MYYQEDRDQISKEEFFLPFGGRLRKDNRWVRLANIVQWAQGDTLKQDGGGHADRQGGYHHQLERLLVSSMHTTGSSGAYGR